MNAFTVGSLIILYFLLSQSVVAYIQTETIQDFEVGDCETIVVDGNNQTTCEGTDGPSFIASVRDVSTTGIDGAPAAFNNIWVGIHTLLLVLGIALIVGWLLGLFFGGAS